MKLSIPLFATEESNVLTFRSDYKTPSHSNSKNHRTFTMEEHSRFLNRFCRFCESELASKYKYKVNSFVEEINFCYRTDGVDIRLDDPNSQSQFLCKSCYRNVKKCQEEIKFRKKNPKSNKLFEYAMPQYKENVTVHLSLGCKCRNDLDEEDTIQGDDGGGAAAGAAAVGAAAAGGAGGGGLDQLMAGTPSKVRRMSGEPQESPRDKLTSREVKAKTPVAKNIKFAFEEAQEDFETGDIVLDEARVKKVYTSRDSFATRRISNMEVGKFFICRVCGQFPKVAKYSTKCHHIYCKVCIENYKTSVNTTKCPPAHANIEDDDDDEETLCQVPSQLDDIGDISGFLKEIHEAIGISCKNENCDKIFNVLDIANHESSCKIRGSYKEKSLATTKSAPLRSDANKAIDFVVEWSEKHRVSPCDFLFFALKRLIGQEAPELEDSIQKVFKQFVKEAKPASAMTPIEGLAVKIDADLSNSQYLKLRRNKLFGSQLPSIQSVTKEKGMLDPGNVEYRILKKSNGEIIEIHPAEPKTGVIDVDNDIGNFSYGDLNINVQGCRATLHDTIAKLFQEKYAEIEDQMKKTNVYDSFSRDPDRKVTIFAKVCFDGTSAAVKSAKGDSRLSVSNWLRGTVGIVAVELTWQEDGVLDAGEVDLATDDIDQRDNGEDEPVGLQDFSSMNISNLAQILKDLPDNMKKMSLRDIINKSKK